MPIRLCLLLILFPPLLSAVPAIQHWQTTNGADVYFVETHELPIVDLQLLFDAGSSRDPGGKKGLALLTNSLLAEAANGMDADAINYEFERLGAVFARDAGYDFASVSLRSLSDQSKLTPALENLRHIITAPDFPENAFQRQRNRLLVGIQHKQQSPSALANDALYAAVYKDHPYAYPNEGNEETLMAIRVKDLQDFYKRHYTSRNATLAIVGDLSKRQAKKLANDLIRPLKKGSKIPSLPPVEALAAADEIKINHPSKQTHILIGQPGMKRGDPDYFALYVGNHVLGGGGMVSRLYEEIREKRGLSYSVYSYFSPMRYKGPFIAGLQTRAGKEQEAIEVVLENLQRFVLEGPDAEELIAAKKNITGGFPLQLDSNKDILAYTGMIGFYKLPLDYLETFNNKIEAITIDQIKDAFKRRISPDKLITVRVGPVDSLPGDAP